ncbi:ABC transporter substrate-binding protein [Nocardia takedensis]|uniref:ABC transporter substrate-binding protein n=1 Tax=Nocardia takedensis TaxID=259390 RepID=UPI0012F66FA0|nr:ABC transporter substrate-binding protein [Nocardia takedensis]
MAIGRRRGGWRLAAVTTLVALVATACAGGGTSGGGDAGPPQTGGTLNIGLNQDLNGVDAAVVNQVWRTVARALSDSLVFYNPDTKQLEPWLATKWDVTDARVYRFQLRQDVTFQDGTKLTGDVVKKNFESLNRPGIHSSAKTIVEGIRQITAPSEYEVVVEFEKPNAAFLTSLSRAHAGIVSAKTAALPVAERQKWIDGSGPFYLQEYIPNQHIVLKKRPEYNWAPAYFGRSGAAYLDEVVYKIIPEDSVRNGAVIGGDELQFIYWVNGKYVDQLKSAGLTISETLNPATGTELPVNTSSKFLQDVRVRQALQVGLNREEYVKIVSKGHDRVAKGPLSESNPYFADVSQYLKYDPDKAVRLLEEAGWKTVGADGIRVNAAGERLRLRGPQDDAGWQVLQSQWRKIGVDLALEPPLRAEANQKLLSGEYDIAYWYHSTPDPDVLRANYGKTTGSNRSFLPDGTEVDALLQEQNTVLDKPARQAIVDKAAELLVREAYVIPVINDVDVWAYQPRLHGIEAVGLDQYLYNAWLEQ